MTPNVLGGNVGDEIPYDPGEWSIRLVDDRGIVGPHLFFGCPRGRGTCGVPMQPSPPNASGCSWQWDQNASAPTLSPSINCVAEKDGKPTGGCGWHGFMNAGRIA